MSANFQYLVGSTTLTSTGLSQNFGVERQLWVTFVNLSSSASASLTLTDENGRTQTYSVAAGLSFGPASASVRQWEFAGTGATVAAIFTSTPFGVSAEALRSMLVSVSGTVTTNTKGVYFTGGTAPMSGVWTLTVSGTDAVPTVNSLALGGTLATGALLTTTIAVQSGSGYTIASCIVQDGWISEA